MSDTVSNRPVIFHSMWRARSTYFFALFRAREEYVAYYEPFNEVLISFADALAQPAEPAHPVLAEPYFREYGLVEENNDIKDFDLNFAYLQKLWFDFDSRCKSYVDNLARAATAGNKTPFLQFNRSFLCLDHFAEFQAPALNAYLYRNPRAQFDSYTSAGKPYYVGLCYLQFAAEVRRRDSSALRFVNVPFFYSQRSFQNTLAFYRSFAELSVATSYYVFFSLWCLGLIDAIRLGFPLIDVDSRRAAGGPGEGVLDFFEREFPDLSLADFDPGTYCGSDESSDVHAAVERLVMGHLEASGYRPHLGAVENCLASIFDEREDRDDGHAALHRHIADELRSATDANFAMIGNGLSLGAARQ